MPIDEDTWETVMERSQTNPTDAGSGIKADVARFLETHESQAFTLTEIDENVTVSQFDLGDSGLKAKVGSLAKRAAKKQVIKHFANQLVAEGHVATRVELVGGSEKLYYRWQPR
jgi:hypothetical protein